jgi:hypothetical protein
MDDSLFEILVQEEKESSFIETHVGSEINDEPDDISEEEYAEYTNNFLDMYEKDITNGLKENVSSKSLVIIDEVELVQICYTLNVFDFVPFKKLKERNPKIMKKLLDLLSYDFYIHYSGSDSCCCYMSEITENHFVIALYFTAEDIIKTAKKK